MDELKVAQCELSCRVLIYKNGEPWKSWDTESDPITFLMALATAFPNGYTVNHIGMIPDEQYEQDFC